MRFSCDSCQARYNIADDKVRGKILRVRCKRCGNAILLKEQDLEPDDELPGSADSEDSTRVVRTDEVQRAIDRAPAPAAPEAASKFVSRSSMAPVAPAKGAKPPEKKEWYVIVGGKEVGPMTRAELTSRVTSGEVTPRTYVWRDGMPQWGRLRDTAELKDVLAAAPGSAPAAAEPKTVMEAQVPEAAREAAKALFLDDSKQKAEAERQRQEEARRQAEEDLAAEIRRQAEEELAEEQRLADERKAAEEKAAADAKKKADDEKKATEAKKKADDDKAAAEAKKKADDEKKAAEAKKKAEDEKKAAEAKKKADEEKKAADAKKKAEDDKAAAEAKKKAEEEKKAAEAKKKADEEKKAAEAKKKAEEEKKAAEAKKKAEDEKKAAEAKKKAEEEKKAAEKKPLVVPEPEEDDEDRTDVGSALSSLLAEASEADADEAKGGHEQLLSIASELELEEPPAEKKPDVAAAFEVEGTHAEEKAPESAGPLVGGAAAKNDDPFAAVPNAPGFHEAAPGEATNAIIRASGAKERNWGKLVAMLAIVIVGLGGAVYAGLRFGGVIQLDAPAKPREEKPSIDWTKVKSLDNGTDDILTGENKRKEEAARVAEEKRKADEEAAKAAEKQHRDSAGDLGMLIPKDDDRQGAIVKAPKKDEPGIELTPEQLAMIAASKSDKPKSAGPGGGPAPKFVADDTFDVKKSSGSGGGPDDRQVAEKIQKAQPAFENCISNALRRNPNLRIGKVRITATIGSSGIVTKAVFDKASVGDTDVGQCLRDAVKRIVFPAFEGDPTDVEIPLAIGTSG